MKQYKYILKDQGEPVPCNDMMEWARWFENAENRKVAQEYVGGQLVSTVFLSLDHSFGAVGPPLLYETMILGGEHDGYQTRCATRDEALKMHAKALQVARGIVAPNEDEAKSG